MTIEPLGLYRAQREVANQARRRRSLKRTWLSGSCVRAFCADGRLRRGRKSLCDLRKPFTKRFTHARENLGAGFAEFFFCGGGYPRYHFARLVIERRDGGQHPLIRNTLHPILIVFRGFLTHPVVD